MKHTRADREAVIAVYRYGVTPSTSEMYWVETGEEVGHVPTSSLSIGAAATLVAETRTARDVSFMRVERNRDQMESNRGNWQNRAEAAEGELAQAKVVATGMQNALKLATQEQQKLQLQLQLQLQECQHALDLIARERDAKLDECESLRSLQTATSEQLYQQVSAGEETIENAYWIMKKLQDRTQVPVAMSERDAFKCAARGMLKNSAATIGEPLTAAEPTPTPAPMHLDTEIDAMARALEQLTRVRKEARGRVLSWLTARLDIDTDPPY